MDYSERKKVIKSRRRELIRITTTFLFVVTVMIFIMTVIGNFYRQQSILILQQNVQRAAVECYSVEGIYPPDVEYLEDHYSFTYNNEKYYIYYETFASNVMPTVEVYERK